MATSRSPGDLFQSFISGLTDLTQASVQSMQRGLDSVVEGVRKAFTLERPPYTLGQAQEHLRDVGTPTSSLLSFTRSVSRTTEALEHFSQGARDAFNAMFDNLKPAGHGVEPDYVYKYGYINDQMQLRKGIWESLKKEPSAEFQERSFNYYTPEARAMSLIKAAAENFQNVFNSMLQKNQNLSTAQWGPEVQEKLRAPFGQFAVSPTIVRTLQDVMYQTYKPLSEYNSLTGDITKYQLHRYATYSLLSRLQGPDFKFDQLGETMNEIDRSFGDVLTEKMKGMTLRAQSYLNEYLKTFQVVSQVPGSMPTTNVSRSLFGGGHKVITYEQMGELGVEIGQSLEKLERLRTLPNLQDEVKRYVLGSLRAQMTGLATDLVKTPAATPALTQTLNRAVSTYGTYDAEYKRYQTLGRTTEAKLSEVESLRNLKQLAEIGDLSGYKTAIENMKKEGFAVKKVNPVTGEVQEIKSLEELVPQNIRGLVTGGWNPNSLSAGADKTKLVTSLDSVIQGLERELKGLTESFRQSKNNSLNLEKQLTNNLRDVIAQAKNVDLSVLPRKEQARYKTMFSEAESAIERLPYFTGEKEAPLVERVKTEYIKPLGSAASQFMGMNVRSFEMALMFGFSSSIFEALTRMPMESTYQTIQPIFGTLGGLTGVTPFWREFQSFSQQAPSVMNDLQSRLNTIHALLGSEGAARQAVGRAINISRVQPIQFPQAMEVLTALSVYPSTRVRAANPQFQQEVFTAVQLLSMLAPEQGVGGALFAIREMLGGQFRSLQMRFNIGPETLAAFAGKSLSEFKGAPGAEKLDILTKALENMFGGKEVLFRKGAQFDVQLKNISDTLVQSIILPMVTKTQATFTDTLDQLFSTRVKNGKIEQTNAPLTTISALKDTAFMQLLPKAQQSMLIQMSEVRGYNQLTEKQQQTVEAAYTAAHPNKTAPTTQDLVNFLSASYKNNPQLDKIYQALQKNTVQNTQVIATQTYGTLSGFLGLVVTAFNNVLPQIVKSFGIASGISHLVTPFAKGAIQLTTQTQFEMSTASTDEEKKKIATQFIKSLAQQFQQAVGNLRNEIQSSGLQTTLKPVIDTIRQISMVTFSPIAEAMVTQTARTALQLPGQFVGGAVEGMVSSIFTEKKAPVSAMSIVSSMAGMGTWGSMFLMDQLGVRTALMAGTGAALIQRGAENFQSGMKGPGLGEMLGGTAMMALSKKSIYEDLITAVANVSEKASLKIRDLIGSERTLALESKLAKLPGVKFLASDKVGLMSGTYEFGGRSVVPLMGLGVGAYEVMTASGSAHPTSQRIAGTLGMVGSALLFAGPGPITRGIGVALMGLEALIPLVSSFFTKQKQEQTNQVAFQKIERQLEKAMETPAQERAQYAREQLAQVSRSYHIGRIYPMVTPTGEVRQVDFSRFEKQYVEYMQFIPQQTASFVKQQVLSPMKEYQKTGVVSESGLPGFIQYVTAQGLKGLTPGTKKYIAEEETQQRAAVELSKGLTPLVKQLGEAKTPEERQALESSMKQLVTSYISIASNHNIDTSSKSIQKAIQAFVESLVKGAHEINAKSEQLKKQIQPEYNTMVGSAIITKTMMKEIYKAGIPEPHPVKTVIGAQQQTQQQTAELISGSVAMVNKLGQFGTSVVDRAVQFGILGPKEAFGLKTAEFVTMGEMIATGKMPVSKAITQPWFGQMYSYLGMVSPELYAKVKEKMREGLLNEGAVGVKEGQEYLKYMRKLPGLNIDTHAIDSKLQALGGSALSAASSLQQLQSSIKSVIEAILPKAPKAQPVTTATTAAVAATAAKTAMNEQPEKKKETPEETLTKFTIQQLGKAQKSPENQATVTIEKQEGLMDKIFGGTRETIPISDMKSKYYQDLMKEGHLKIVGITTGAHGAYGLPAHSFFKYEQLPTEVRQEIAKGQVKSPQQQTLETRAETKAIVEKTEKKEELTKPEKAPQVHVQIKTPELKAATPTPVKVVAGEKTTKESETAAATATVVKQVVNTQHEQTKQAQKEQPINVHVAVHETAGGQATVTKQVAGAAARVTASVQSTKSQQPITDTGFGVLQELQRQHTTHLQSALSHPLPRFQLGPDLMSSPQSFKSPTTSLLQLYQSGSHVGGFLAGKLPALGNLNDTGFGVLQNLERQVPSTAPKVPDLSSLLIPLSRTASTGFETFKPLMANEPQVPLWNPNKFSEHMQTVNQAVRMNELSVKVIKADNTFLS